MTAPKSSLDERLSNLASTPSLLVACDYDGTLAPIVSDPGNARPLPEAVSALRALAILRDTNVALISGRALHDLALLSRLPHEIHLVGSHGSEFDLSFTDTIPAPAKALHRRLRTAAAQLVREHPGLRIEDKPASITFHVRGMKRQAATDALHAVLRGPGRLDGVFVHEGKRAVELLVVPTDKGRALERLRHATGATATLYIGDDTTDEDAFATLTGPDVGVKVGKGRTLAEHRVQGPADVALLLARLAEERQRWVLGEKAVPIEQHTLLSDHTTTALLTTEGRITWLCEPALDGAAVFSELVGGPRAGYFSVQPANGARPIGHRYIRDSLIAETRWPGLQVVDYLDTTTPGLPTRLVRVLSGKVAAQVELAPRPDFGRAHTALSATADGFEVVASSTALSVRSPGVKWNILDDGQHQTAYAEIPVSGEPVVIELIIGDASMLASGPEPALREQVLAHWSNWAGALRLPALEPDTVLRHALTIKALCSPYGSIAAAATTSLPEHIGGIRNWDYRYCWIRDAALAATSLVRLHSTTEAVALLDWIADRAKDLPSGYLRPVYSLQGHDLAPEASIIELSGYAGSRPVRIGNAADHQIQLDVAGPVAELMYELVERDVVLAPTHLVLLVRLVDMVAERWNQPDHGVWEVRTAPQHHVHSRVMSWVTVDRAIKIYERCNDELPRHWKKLRSTIADDVISKGWKPAIDSFTDTYERDDINAATLHVGLSGLLAPDDPRFAATVQAVETHLRNGPVVYRYHADDGLPGREGGFLLCGSWLVDAYELCGRHDDAIALFNDLNELAGPSGLLSEEYDPVSRRSLGNIPQTYSHHGLIDNAVRLSQHA
jgi:trehalose 6-phosphate phosphatase